MVLVLPAQYHLLQNYCTMPIIAYCILVTVYLYLCICICMCGFDIARAIPSPPKLLHHARDLLLPNAYCIFVTVYVYLRICICVFVFFYFICGFNIARAIPSPPKLLHNACDLLLSIVFL